MKVVSRVVALLLRPIALESPDQHRPNNVLLRSTKCKGSPSTVSSIAVIPAIPIIPAVVTVGLHADGRAGAAVTARGRRANVALALTLGGGVVPFCGG